VLAEPEQQHDHRDQVGNAFHGFDFIAASASIGSS
jgi:hypothetical protein